MSVTDSEPDELNTLCDWYGIGEPERTDIRELIASEHKKAAIEELKNLQHTPIGGKIADWKESKRTSHEAFRAIQDVINVRLATLSQEGDHD